MFQVAMRTLTGLGFVEQRNGANEEVAISVGRRETLDVLPSTGESTMLQALSTTGEETLIQSSGRTAPISRECSKRCRRAVAAMATRAGTKRKKEPETEEKEGVSRRVNPEKLSSRAVRL